MSKMRKEGSTWVGEVGEVGGGGRARGGRKQMSAVG